MLKKMIHSRALIQVLSGRFVLLMSAVSFVCLVLFISNTTPLYCMATVAVLTALVTSPRRYISWYTLLFAAYIIYLALCDHFMFPDGTAFAARRRAVLAFLSGVAIFQVVKEDRAYFTCQLTVVLPAIAIPAILICYLDGSLTGLMHGYRLRLFNSHANFLAMFASVAFLSGLAFLLSKAERIFSFPLRNCFISPNIGRGSASIWRRVLLGAATAASLAILVATLSRTSLFATISIAGLLVLHWSLSNFKGRKKLCLLAGMLALVLAGSFTMYKLSPHSPGLKRIFSAAINPWESDTFISRMPLWEIGWASFVKNPVFGNGPESFERLTAEFIADNHASLVERYGREIIELDTSRQHNAHNQYLMVLCESGIIGFVLFLPLFFAPIVSGIRQHNMYGAVVPLLLYFAVCFFLEAPMIGNRSAAFSTTLVHMLMGYYSCIRPPRIAHSPKSLEV